LQVGAEIDKKHFQILQKMESQKCETRPLEEAWYTCIASDQEDRYSKTRWM